MTELLSQMDIVLKDAINASNCAFTTTTNGIKVDKYHRCLILLIALDAGTAATITLKQGTSSTVNTALSFTKMWSKLDISSSNEWLETAVTSDTFNTGTSSKTAVYAIDVDLDTLSKTAGSEATYLRCNVATGTSGKGVLIYIPYSPRYGTDMADKPAIA